MCGHGLGKGLFYTGSEKIRGIFCQSCHSKIVDKHCVVCKSPVLTRGLGDGSALVAHQECFKCKKCSSALESRFRVQGDALFCEKHGPSPSLDVKVVTVRHSAPEMADRRSLMDVVAIPAPSLYIRPVPDDDVVIDGGGKSPSSPSSPSRGKLLPSRLSTGGTSPRGVPVSPRSALKGSGSIGASISRKITRSEDWKAVTGDGSVSSRDGSSKDSTSRAQSEIAAAGVSAAERKRLYEEQTRMVGEPTSPRMSGRKAETPGSAGSARRCGSSGELLRRAGGGARATTPDPIRRKSALQGRQTQPLKAGHDQDSNPESKNNNNNNNYNKEDFDILEFLGGDVGLGALVAGSLDSGGATSAADVASSILAPSASSGIKALGSGKSPIRAKKGRKNLLVGGGVLPSGKIDFSMEEMGAGEALSCERCQKKIVDPFFIRAGDEGRARGWHLNCFKCTACETPMQQRVDDSTGSAFEHLGAVICERCFEVHEGRRLGKVVPEDDENNDPDGPVVKAYREWEMNYIMAQFGWPSNALSAGELALLDAPDWRVECGTPQVAPDDVDFSFVDYRRRYYAEMLHPVEHTVHFLTGDMIGIFCLESQSRLRERTDDGGVARLHRAIMFSPRGEERVVLRLEEGANKQMRRKAMQELHPLLKADNAELVLVKDAEALKTDLLEHERKLFKPKLKFGVLYMRPGQENEDEMYGNLETSPRFEKFLTLLGDKIELVGHQGYAGGLSVQDESNGKHSIFTRFGDHEIMYHVSTMIPKTEEDVQGVFRKKFLGNDVVLIVFIDGPLETEGEDGQPRRLKGFNPECVSSHFNHIFCIVQPVEDDDDPKNYRVAFAYKHGTRPTKPYLPHPAVFEHGQAMREFLLTKLINGEYSALFGSPEFASAVKKTRKMLLEEIVQKHGPKKVQKAMLGDSAKQRKSFLGMYS